MSDFLQRFRELGLMAQAVFLGCIFFTIYDVSLYFGGGLDPWAAANEAAIGAGIFAAAYYLTSLLALFLKRRRREAGQGKGKRKI
ncbi:MAG: hypothetical protein A4E45_01621 [Methanosaeta sp. PtaB.Bin039]|nr:MAG: hypothetical protein A4E45_01621 [Methanosaeta sp. PtaB.Bin039]OPY44229.1 MAG: hypothetical protein A4E47_01696 [Methanosaeta sp. PtaU1.Bin028]HOT07240.1 hypothetical protein [Methanotrichaceae archaeon]HQF17268.1 hypothetical protein [Methanotrichaceae archaeon]HQI91841.1 hypothetical protein [Methanotrichaceae archaeon]